jgi:hypothetical protein
LFLLLLVELLLVLLQRHLWVAQVWDHAVL